MRYGFVEVSKDEEYVFAHLKTIRNFKIYYLDEGKNLSLKFIEYGCQPLASEGCALKFAIKKWPPFEEVSKITIIPRQSPVIL